MKRPVRTVLSKTNLSKRGVPKKFHDTTLDDFVSTTSGTLKVKNYVKEYIDNIDERFSQCSGIFFYGSNGTGKTMLSSIIIKEAYRHRYTSKRATFAEYVTEYTRVWGVKDPKEKEALEEMFYHELKGVEFLCLEEIGKEIDSSITAPILEDCLRYREDNGLVTIVCTNLKPVAISEKYGASIESLIKGNFEPIALVDDDHRMSTFKKRSR